MFLAVLGLCCCVGFSLSCGKHGLCSSCSERPLIAVAALVAEHRLYACGLHQLRHMGSIVAVPQVWSTGSIVAAHRFSHSAACGIFPDRGSNQHLLRWQVDSLPLCHQRSLVFLNYKLFQTLAKLK